MQKLASVLAQDYQIHNIDYPSTKMNISELSTMIYNQITSIDSDEPWHAVGHSMGAVIIKTIALDKGFEFERVVMLAPPLNGSSLVQRLKQWRLYRMLYGPAGCELGTDEESWPLKLDRKMPFDCGIITGSRVETHNLIWGKICLPLIHKKTTINDGILTEPEQTHNDIPHINIPSAGHTELPNNKEVQYRTQHYLLYATFDASSLPNMPNQP